MMQEAPTQHVPVLLQEVLEAFRCRPGTQESKLYADLTLGGGGHAAALLAQEASFVLLGIDRDTETLQRTKEALSGFSQRCHFVQGPFSRLEQYLDALPEQLLARLPSAARHPNVLCAAILADLGVSSFQFDQGSRGFSFRMDAPLDMRMNPQQPLDAAQVVNEYEPQELKRVFQRGGVGAQSAALARLLVSKRPIESTQALAGISEPLFRKKGKAAGSAAVVFQAIRIEVNDELGEIQRLLDTIPSRLAPGGRLAVISFHSLEDKLVASRMRQWSRERRPIKQLPSADIPALGRLLTPAAILPTEEECLENPRARSARLRIFQMHSNDDEPMYVRSGEK